MYFFVSQKVLRATRKLPADASGGRWKKIHIIGIICSLNLMILTEVTRMIVDDFLIGNSFGIADFSCSQICIDPGGASVDGRKQEMEGNDRTQDDVS